MVVFVFIHCWGVGLKNQSKQLRFDFKVHVRFFIITFCIGVHGS